MAGKNHVKRVRFSDGHTFNFPHSQRLRGVRFALLRGESIYCPYCWRESRSQVPVTLAERYTRLKRSRHPGDPATWPKIDWLSTRWPKGYEGWGIVRAGQTLPSSSFVHSSFATRSIEI